MINSVEEEKVNALLSRTPNDLVEAEAWLADTWQYFIETGLYFAGGPASDASRFRLQLIDKAQEIAREINALSVRADANRITAHVLNASEQYPRAAEVYELAVRDLEALNHVETANRTRLGYAAALMMSGNYNRALEVCGQADAWFVANGDQNGHARAMVNTGNIWHRLDEHARALECQLNAAEIFESLGNRNDWAATAHNAANSYSMLSRFEESDAQYALAEEVATAAGLDSLAEQARYNRSYLYFLRGRYSDSIRSFNSLRKYFISSDSKRHAALCDLDESEVYLHLNLPEDAAALADSARFAFHDLGMLYEEAKATAFRGVAETQRRRYQEALDLFQEAGPKFAQEKNAFWEGMIELYRAEVLLSLGRFWEARFLGESARQRFESRDVAYQKGMSLIVLGRTALETQRTQDLQALSVELQDLVMTGDVPLLAFPAHMLCARIEEQGGKGAEARQLYMLAAAAIETHRSYLHHDELRVRFLEGKVSVYESLVHLDLQDESPESVSDAFIWCERAKARALIDLLGQHLPAVKSDASPELLKHINDLREALNSHYVRARPDGNTGSGASRQEIVKTEAELEHSIKQLSEMDENFGVLFGVTPGSLTEIQAAIPDELTVVEFFIARGEIMAFVVTNNRVKVHRHLLSIEKLQQLRQALDFQMQRLMLGSEHTNKHADQLLKVANHYLEQLRQDLVSRWQDEIETKALVLVPHGELHALPIHALYDGEQYLCDRFDISYAPSAEVLRLMLATPKVVAQNRGVLLGLADELAPAINKEIARIHSLSPGSTVLAGAQATRAALLKTAPNASFVHISTHSFFRKDNPVFSGFNLADGPITALDLYSQSWPCELVTLSGCSSGVTRVAAGDDLLGLVRGVLHAGARSLLMSLWNVSDEATVELMENFYRAWLDGNSKSAALTIAMKRVRARYPHPFYWAPFVLLGAP